MVESTLLKKLLNNRSLLDSYRENRQNALDQGNDTCPLLSIHDMRVLRMVVDYEDDKIMFKDNPNVWHELPTTRKGLMMVPLTKEACERHAKTPPPPQPPQTTAKRKNNKKKETVFVADVQCRCDCKEADGLASSALLCC